MRIKKAFLGASLITMSAATPIAVAVSCGKNVGISKWKTGLKVGQEYSLEKTPHSSTSTIEYAMDEKLAKETMALQVWLAGFGFRLFSNTTSMFDYLLDDMPITKIKQKHQWSNEETKLLETPSRTPEEEERLTKIQRELPEVQTEIDDWIEKELKNLQNCSRNKIQGVTWTSNGIDVLKNHQRTYKITDIKDTTEGVAIKTTLSTLPPKGEINGYSMETWVDNSRKPITIKGVKNDIKALWEKIKADKEHSKNEAFYNKNAIMKKFLGVKFSQTIFKKDSPEPNKPNLTLPEAMLELKNTNSNEFDNYIEIFRRIEESIHNTIMKKINDNNGDITKIFEVKMYTYTPSQILKDLQQRAKSNPKLLGNVKPRNLTWIK